MSIEEIAVEIACATPEKQRLLRVTVPAGTTAAGAIAQSAILSEFPGLTPEKVGIFGRVVAPETVLQEGDRVEIYRGLLVDPMEARRARAREKR